MARLGGVLPWSIPEIVNALMWQWIYNPTYGAFNGILGLGAARPLPRLAQTPGSAMHAIIFAYAWKLVPFVVIILYRGAPRCPQTSTSPPRRGAGTGAVPPHHVPLLAPPVAVAVTFCMVWSMRAFDIVYLLTKGGPGRHVVLSYLTFGKAFEFGDIGAAAAVACLLAAVTLVMTLVYLRVLPEGEP